MLLQHQKCKLFKFLSYGFLVAVLLQSTFIGIRFGVWNGVIATVVGFIGGFIFARIKRNNDRKSGRNQVSAPPGGNS
jgi:hypothetical protein